MAWVNKEDYAARINVELLDLLLAENEQALLSAVSKTAVDTITAKAGVLYDVAAAFQKAGDDRDGYLLSIALSICLYELYQRVDDYEVPEKVIKNYDDAIETLTRVSTGKEPLNLPAKAAADSGDGNAGGGGSEAVEPGGIGLRRIGSAAKRTHRI